jgi:hypothetical protein
MPVEWNNDLITRLRAAAFRGVVIGTEMLRTEGNRLITEGPKTGRIYQRRGVTHQASAPGEPPATDTGRLVQSARTEFDQEKLQGDAIWSTDYAGKLEYGTPKIEPRPYASVAVNNKRQEITDAIINEIKTVLP